jgi:hypothetical protein
MKYKKLRGVRANPLPKKKKKPKGKIKDGTMP